MLQPPNEWGELQSLFEGYVARLQLVPRAYAFLYLFATTPVCPAQPVLTHALMLQRQETEEAVPARKLGNDSGKSSAKETLNQQQRQHK